ncbi:phosphotransferase [Bacillaceae bacterium Marseille-Q3522]|nr:phosphotransferase [Bacillaceae bacterium Marseille-Q3522]
MTISISNANWGDDETRNRLLSLLQKQCSIQADQVTRIRKHVYLVMFHKNPFIIKGFSSLQRLTVQAAFTASLHKEGFKQTYQFFSCCNESFYLDGNYYGFLQYLQEEEPIFSYLHDYDRSTGLNLLENYHHASKKLADRYKKLVPSFQLLEKWQGRFNTFCRNLSFVKFFLRREEIDMLLEWAGWSLKGIAEEQLFFAEDDSVILHGDVAHHNFLRSKKGVLYLLDFDLISYGGAHADILQYANRILPFLNWSFAALQIYPQIRRYCNHKGFIYALAFPSDIFREWNRLIREKGYVNPEKMRRVMALTVSNLQKRQHFFQELKQTINKPALF